MRWQKANDKPTPDISNWFYSLSKSEIEIILNSGMNLSIVQAFGGRPKSHKNGYDKGYTATHNCKKLGIPEGTTIWCDAEWHYKPSPPDKEVIEYLNGWGQAVAENGYD